MASPHDIEAGAVSALSAATGVRWATRVPNPRPEVFGRVTRIGGVRSNLIIEAPLMLVEAWALNEGDAFALASSAWSVFDRLDREGGWLGQAWVAECGPASPISNYDTITNLPRFQFTVNLSVSLKES